ncbi:MAG: hypothetical protein EON86_12165 [Brevundimonas sp.]|nr:MAG: hypothetical protein EON86_12165 [Brevundimonas sp.]
MSEPPETPRPRPRPGRVARLGRIPDIAETQAYVASVIDCYLALTAGRTVRHAPQCRRPERVQ